MTGTPNGNDFVNGKTEAYTYSSGFSDYRLNHELLTITAPNEVASGGPARVTATYNLSSSSPDAGRVTQLALGGQNQTNVPAGGSIMYAYQSLTTASPGDFSTAVFQTTVTDRNTNVTQYQFNQRGNIVQTLEYTNSSQIPRSGQPTYFETDYAYNGDYELTQTTMPLTNSTSNVYDSGPDRLEQGNLLSTTQTPDSTRGGDQSQIETTYTYEPIFNQVRTTTDPRGNDSGYTPPIGSNSAARYTTVNYFDYQESTQLASASSDSSINTSPLISYDANVLTTEVMLVRLLALPETSSGLNTLRSRLSADGVVLGLGDLNGDGDTTPTVQGNIIRTEQPTVQLLAGTNEAAIEGATSQPIVTQYICNSYGLPTKTIDPEGNANENLYYAVSSPGPGSGTPSSAGGGYLAETIQDSSAGLIGRDSGTNPSATNITDLMGYDSVGNVTSETDGRGITTQYVVNQLNQIVETIRAEAVPSSTSTAEPLALTAYAYLERTFYDYNNNVVWTQTEDRGNTSNVAGNPSIGDIPSFLIAQASTTASGGTSTTLSDTSQSWASNVWTGDTVQITGGTGAGQVRRITSNTSNQLTVSQMWMTAPDSTSTYAILSVKNAEDTSYVDSITKYDILDQPVESLQEVSSGGASPTFLQMRTRYDANGNSVLTIMPEGNASSSVYDERDLLFQSTTGTSTRPTAGMYVSGDPTTFNRPGGSGTTASTVTYNYDENGNQIEVVSPVSHGGITSSIAGAGDVSGTTYDGFDRVKVTTDALGNTSINTYDPAGNTVRVVQKGAAVDDTYSADHTPTLAVTDYFPDELSRTFVTQQVIFLISGNLPNRTPTLTSNSAMDSLVASLAVSGTSGITVLGRISSITEYDRDSRVAFTVDDALHVSGTDYDGASRVVKTTDSALNNGFSGSAFNPANLAGNTVETAYDGNSNAIEVKSTEVTTVASVADEVFRTTNFYDALNRLQTTVDNLGHASDDRYDSRDDLVASSDSKGPVTSRSIQRRGLSSSATVSINDFGNVTLTTVDGQGRTVETDQLLTSSGEGNGTFIGADDYGENTSIPSGYLDASQGGGDGINSSYQAWDKNSELLAARDDNGATTEYERDNEDRLLVVRDGVELTGDTFTEVDDSEAGSFDEALPVGGYVTPDTTTQSTLTDSYDGDSLMTSNTDLSGNVFANTFDALGRKKSVTVTIATGTAFTGSTQQSWTYDGLSRQTSAIDGNTSVMPSITITTTDIYDSLSRKIEEHQEIGSGAEIVSYNFDVGASGSVDQPSSLIYPDGRQLDSTYDNLDRLISHTDDGQSSAIGTYQYIGPSRVATLTFQNNTRLTYIGQEYGHNADVGYDPGQRIVNLRWETTGAALGEGTVVVGFNYQYDSNNNVLVAEKLHDPGNSEVYTYQSDGQLASFARGTLNMAKTAITTPTTTTGVLQSQNWTLDGQGNWDQTQTTTRTSTGSVTNTETRTQSANNEIDTQTVNMGMPTGLTYDANGNLTDDGVRKYVWDAFNRLVTVETESGTTVVASYFYDASGRRVRSVVSAGGINGNATNGTTDFYYDGPRVIEEHDGSNAITQQYVYGNGEDEVWTLDNRRSSITVADLNDHTGGERHFYHYDRLNSVYGLTDESHALVEGYMYDPYGKQTVVTPTSPSVTVSFSSGDTWTVGGTSTVFNTNMFTGQRFDAETGLDYFKARYYQVDLGRFISRDPAKADGNLYRYSGNGPTNHVDPLGLQAEDPVYTVAPATGGVDRGQGLGSWTYVNQAFSVGWWKWCQGDITINAYAERRFKKGKDGDDKELTNFATFIGLEYEYTNIVWTTTKEKVANQKSELWLPIRLVGVFIVPTIENSVQKFKQPPSILNFQADFIADLRKLPAGHGKEKVPG